MTPGDAPAIALPPAGRPAREATDLWWKNAVVYCLDVETFHDANGDGVGDMAGLLLRLDYLAALGVSCLWLMPFHPTPNRDDGYDVTDYYGVDPRLGTPGDVVEVLRAARERGIRVVMDLVVNHTSDEHPWFRAATADPGSPYRDYYVWADGPQEEPGEIVFPGEQDGNWTPDPGGSGQWYLHTFMPFQPDLNVRNPCVQEELARIMGFWAQLGVSGFRIDAVPYLISSAGQDVERHDPHEYLRAMQSLVARRAADAILLGEVNVALDELRSYFGDEDGDELNMLFDFPLMNAVYLALARHDSRPIERVLEELPEIPRRGQWATFLRIHDEVTLSVLSDDEREEVFAALAPDEEMQIYGRGMRRRLAPMLGGDGPRLRCALSLLLSLPGTPVLFYGDEIGMGDRLDLHGRMSARTPMQWTADPGAGFTAAPDRIVRPVVDDGRFAFERVNVAAQRRDHDSLLRWVQNAIAVRRQCPELGWGAVRFVKTHEDAVLAHRVDWEGETILAVHNLAGDERPVRLELDAGERDHRRLDLLSDDGYDELGDDGEFTIRPYGYRWIRLRGASSVRVTL